MIGSEAGIGDPERPAGAERTAPPERRAVPYDRTVPYDRAASYERPGPYDEGPPYVRRRKSVLTAALLSMMPGLGQVYLGYYQRGFIHVLVVGGIIATLSAEALHGLEPLLGFFLSFFWLYSIVDAIRTANLYNEVMAGLGPEDLRQQLVVSGRGGSIVGGVLLIFFGILFLLNRVAGLSLEWMKDWWPLAPVCVGVYLLAKGIQDRRRRAAG